jgi:hypothetical protein
VPERILDPGIGVEHDMPGAVVDQAGRQAHPQLAAAGGRQLPAAQPGPDEMQFGLGHGAFEAEQQPVVELAGIVEAVLVADQRRGQRADLQQPVPVGVVAGQPGHLQAEYDPGPAHADLGDQVLEAFPVGGTGTGVPLVGVDGDDLGGGPAQRGGALAQRVLAGGGLGVVEDLFERGLAHIQVGVAGQVAGGHLHRGFGAHRGSPPRGQAR